MGLLTLLLVVVGIYSLGKGGMSWANKIIWGTVLLSLVLVSMAIFTMGLIIADGQEKIASPYALAQRMDDILLNVTRPIYDLHWKPQPTLLDTQITGVVSGASLFWIDMLRPMVSAAVIPGNWLGRMMPEEQRLVLAYILNYGIQGVGFWWIGYLLWSVVPVWIKLKTKKVINTLSIK